jgi:uncharacterized iron-regulated membrane protein
MTTRKRILRAVRRLHLYIGLASALYFMLIAATGVALNHRQLFGLEAHYVSRQWLPESYRPDDGVEVRSDIVIGDLHSGLIFGKAGAPVMDLVAAFWFVSLVTGLSIAVLGRRAAAKAGTAPEPSVTYELQTQGAHGANRQEISAR